jgi:hypothetical protein
VIPSAAPSTGAGALLERNAELSMLAESLEALPPGRELAMAYANLASTHSSAGRGEEAVRWAGRALELAERQDATEIVVDALTTIGACQFGREGEEKLERSLDLARRAGLVEQVGRTYLVLLGTAVAARLGLAGQEQTSAG